ncbi:MAG: hypothetical protein PHS73_01495 [Candidatus Peribacteraceae bacterium]|nr:hypothetical protein [Candidatus Peribacteraceae bacterium]
MNIHIHHQRHSADPDRERRPGERRVRERIEQELKKFFGNDLMLQHWTETLLAMWEEAIDMGCTPETAQEKLDESLRAVITYHRLDLPILQRRKMIQDVLDHMSREIKTEAHHAEESLPVPASREERRTEERQRERDDDPRTGLRMSNESSQRERKAQQRRVNRSGHASLGVQRVF